MNGSIPVVSWGQLPQLCSLPSSNVFPVFLLWMESVEKQNLSAVHVQFTNNKYIILLWTMFLSVRNPSTAPCRLLWRKLAPSQQDLIEIWRKNTERKSTRFYNILMYLKIYIHIKVPLTFKDITLKYGLILQGLL